MDFVRVSNYYIVRSLFRGGFSYLSQYSSGAGLDNRAARSSGATAVCPCRLCRDGRLMPQCVPDVWSEVVVLAGTFTGC